MQTAIMWLQEQIFNSDWKNMSGEDKLKLFEQAKEMEKQQIIKSILMWDIRTTLKEEDKGSMSEIEEFVNETYGSKGSDETKTNIMEYRKKPVVIEAFRYGMDSRPDWFDTKVTSNEIITYVGTDIRDSSEYYCEIKTLEGIMRGNCGDYIIKGVQGEVYPCKPDIFEMTYELASTSSQTEISDEEIERIAEEKYPLSRLVNKDYKGMIISAERGAWVNACKWYREQLKCKGNG